jgi:bifunctional UDP-N-acetylglucosamine pyrophosphorylase/glucosamine-1-phosphate N-acetyltransferase
VLFAEQIQQLGTGHAAMMAAPHFDNEVPVDVFVLAGDMPLIRPATLQKLLEAHRRTGAAVSLATAFLDDPTGYGRILRDDQGRFQAIVEEKDASEAQRAIREVNPSFYCFRSDRLFEALSKVDNRNQQGEFYLTDAPGQLARMGHTVTLLDEVAPEEAAGVNTPQQLEAAGALMRERQDATG